MELPETIKVGPFQYQIRTDQSSLNNVHNNFGLFGVGQCNESQLEITLDLSLAPDQLASTLLHEVLHAVTFLVGYRQDAKVEDWVSRTAPSLLEILRNNPKLVDYLTERKPTDYSSIIPNGLAKVKL